MSLKNTSFLKTMYLCKKTKPTPLPGSKKKQGVEMPVTPIIGKMYLFCLHKKMPLPLVLLGHRTCWGPQKSLRGICFPLCHSLFWEDWQDSFIPRTIQHEGPKGQDVTKQGLGWACGSSQLELCFTLLLLTSSNFQVLLAYQFARGYLLDNWYRKRKLRPVRESINFCPVQIHGKDHHSLNRTRSLAHAKRNTIEELKATTIQRAKQSRDVALNFTLTTLLFETW